MRKPTRSKNYEYTLQFALCMQLAYYTWFYKLNIAAVVWLQFINPRLYHILFANVCIKYRHLLTWPIGNGSANLDFEPEFIYLKFLWCFYNY